MGRRHHHSEEEKAAEQQHHSVSSSVASLFSSSHPSLLYLLVPLLCSCRFVFSGVLGEWDGGEEAAGRAGVVAAAVHVEMREVHAVQAGARVSAARDAGDGGVLPGSMEVQVWQQALHAVIDDV
ncbi:hypothetical protein LINGRAHAP2_LOCUS21581 [Linum grandiflorum]